MRTVDIVVAGLFAPAYVTAVGLADLYAQIPLRIALGLGTGAIALSSQDTGRSDTKTRDRAITQAFLVGFLAGLPLIAGSLLFSEFLIAILGAKREVVRLGASYLTLVFAAAPMCIVGLIGARSLQGTGDTVTPMIVNGGANFCNAAATVLLALSIGPLPRMGIVGIGFAKLLASVTRAADEFLIWGSKEFDLIELLDRYCRTSSIMPRKKNPRTITTVQRDSNDMIGEVMQQFTTTKNVSGSVGLSMSVLD
jgi:Na+-driven multidrug efflux pump